MNILIIITDQLRWDSVGFNSDLAPQTPHLDNLARQSLNLNAAFCQSPQCCPSRASLFTGRYPTAHKLWWNTAKFNNSEVTLGEYFSEWKSHYFGKLHFMDTARGFDSSFLYSDWIRSAPKSVVENFSACMKTPFWTGVIQQEHYHHDYQIVQKALDTELSGKSLMVVSFHGPHPPYAAPSIFSDRYGGKSSGMAEVKRQYFGCITWIDHLIGLLLNSHNFDTILFCSDHGDMLGNHGVFSKGLVAYDDVVRIPVLLKSPGLPTGVYPYLVEQIDLLPTLMSLAGLKVPVGIQGLDLVSSLIERSPARSSVLSMIGYSPRLRMIRSSRAKYWLVGDDQYGFDLESDPGENFPDLIDDGLRFELLKRLILAEDVLPVPYC